MNIQKHVLAAVAIIMGILFTTTSAWAGSKQRHRWEGVAIGVGAAVLGGALLSGCVGVPYVAPPVAVSLNYVEYDPPPHVYHHYYRPPKTYRHYRHDYRPEWRKHPHKHHYRGHRRCCD